MLKETQHKGTRACVPLYFSHMVAEQRCSMISAERAEDLQKVGEQPVESRVEAQNAVVPQMVEQWLEVPKIMPQDRILQTAKQIADHLDKRDLARAEGKTFSDEWKAQMDRRDRCAVGRVITGEEKLHGEKLKSMVEECAAKVVGELQKRMATETGENQLEEVDNQIEWAVHGGGQLMASLRTQGQDGGPGQDLRPWETSKEAHEAHKQGKFG